MSKIPRADVLIALLDIRIKIIAYSGRDREHNYPVLEKFIIGLDQGSKIVHTNFELLPNSNSARTFAQLINNNFLLFFIVD